MVINSLHKQLLNNYQQNFPLSPTPYQDIAESLNISEEEVLTALTELMENRFISRIGPVIPPNRIGVSALAAISVPQERLQSVAEMINRFPEVNHNYEREHRINLWFVIIASDDNHLQAVFSEIERETGFKPMQLPLLTDYYINLGFDLELHD